MASFAKKMITYKQNSMPRLTESDIDELVNINEKIKNKEKVYTHESYTIGRLSNKLSSLKDAINDLALIKDTSIINKIRELKKVFQVSRITDDEIIVKLGRYFLEGNGIKADLGNITLKIEYDNAITFVTDKRDRYYVHPHAYNDGEVCLGDWEELFDEAFKKYDFIKIVALAQGFLNSYDDDDSFTSIENFVYCEDCGGLLKDDGSCSFCNEEDDDE